MLERQVEILKTSNNDMRIFYLYLFKTLKSIGSRIWISNFDMDLDPNPEQDTNRFHTRNFTQDNNLTNEKK